MTFPQPPSIPQRSASQPTAPQPPPIPSSTPAAFPAAAQQSQQSEQEPNVGWYPSAQSGYSPMAGPYAAASPYASPGARSRRFPGRPGATGKPGGRLPTWGGSRGPLLNVTLFGVAPLALVGIVVAAFVIASPGKGEAASHTGFTAGAGPSAGQQQPQGSGSTAPGQPSASPGSSGSSSPGKRSSMPTGHAHPSSSASSGSAQHSGGSGGSGGSNPKPKPSKKSKPKSSGSGRVTPADLGIPNFAGYCAHIGQGTAVMVTNTATGWHCSANTGLTLSVQGACAYSYGLSLSKVINVSTNYFSANAWECWRTNGILGQLNIASYCTASGQGAAKLSASNAYGWTCAGAAIDTDAACQLMYSNSTTFSRFAVFQDPYSWQCWD